MHYEIKASTVAAVAGGSPCSKDRSKNGVVFTAYGRLGGYGWCYFVLVARGTYAIVERDTQIERPSFA